MRLVELVPYNEIRQRSPRTFIFSLFPEIGTTISGPGIGGLGRETCVTLSTPLCGFRIEPSVEPTSMTEFILTVCLERWSGEEGTFVSNLLGITPII